jgi:WD40 repeat protein
MRVSEEGGLRKVVSFSPDGRKIPVVETTSGKCIAVWDAVTGKEIRPKK